MSEKEKLNAEVISVYPNKVKISIDDITEFQGTEEKLKVGSYLRIADNDNAVLIAIIENFSIEVVDAASGMERKYIIEANPLGLIRGGKFERGGDTITIPPKKVDPAKKEEIEKIFMESLEDKKKFVFSRLSTNKDIVVPVDGDKFFNKHVAIIGSTGSGKSHSVAKIIQNAISSKEGEYEGLNNSHIVIFDIHSEYRTAFPSANFIDIANLVLPYWLLNSDELQELFLDTEANDHNQRNVFKEAVITSRKNNFTGSDDKKEKIHFDSPLLFKLEDILKMVKEKNEEMVPGAKDLKAGPLNGKLSNFLSRLENKIHDTRLDFLLGEKSENISFKDTLNQFLSFKEDSWANVTIIDLSGVPFEVLSITVSLISRILFQYGYFYKRLRHEKNNDEKINNDIPLLLVYEEAHKYVPKSDSAKYRASKESIERIAKEGRKYGVSLLLASQRPSEISETIFSQCNNFLALRLTNPNDQDYVKRLLPDTLGNLIDKMPTLKAGEALLIGDAVVLPSVIQVDRCDPEPSSNDIPYYQLWKEKWKTLDINAIKNIWYKN